MFRQPRDRDLIDVADDFLTQCARVQPQQRQACGTAARDRRASGPSQRRAPRVGDDVIVRVSDRIRRADATATTSLARGDAVRRAVAFPDVGRSPRRSPTGEVFKWRGDLDRTPQRRRQIESEISRLENDANPLDERASDERVRRLAYLKRQRRAVADVSVRRDAVAAKLDTCIVALQNIKLDLLRLKAGSQTPQHITSLAMDALNLADSVDSALYVEEGRNTGTRPASRQAAR